MELKDIDLAIKLSKAIKDNFCSKPPIGFTEKDVDHLAEVGLCDRPAKNMIFVVYNIDELNDLKQKAIIEQKVKEQNDLAHKREMKRSAIKNFLLQLPALLSKLFSLFSKG